MVKTELDDKSRIICDWCDYKVEFNTYADAITYLTGRGRLYGWRTSENKDNWHVCPLHEDDTNLENTRMNLEMFL